MRLKRTSNLYLIELIKDLREQSIKEKAPIWKTIAHELEKPSRIRRKVNLSRVNNHADPKRAVIVPGKVLGSGKLTNKFVIAAWDFSAQAIDKIKAAKGEHLTIRQLMRRYPKGRSITIIG